MEYSSGIQLLQPGEIFANDVYACVSLAPFANY